MKLSSASSPDRGATLRNTAVLALAIVAAVAAADRDYFARDRRERPSFESAWAPLDREYVAFLRDASRQTRAGENVLVVLESPSGHPYFYAMYELPGRVVLAANSKSGKNVHLTAAADALVVWPEGFVRPAGFEVTYRGHGGLLARRTR